MLIIEPELGYDAVCSKLPPPGEKFFGGRIRLEISHCHQVRITQITSCSILPQPKSIRYSLRNSSKLPVLKTNIDQPV